MLKTIKQIIIKYFPSGWYFHLYRQTFSRLIKDDRSARDASFYKLVERFKERKGLQIGVRKQKFSPAWVSVDLYDKSDYIDFHYDIMNLEFPDEVFDVVVCAAVLEHVPDPGRAIAELRRVLKPGGEIWIEVPFCQPFHPSPQDYWRVTQLGLREWMKDFAEVESGYFLSQGSPIHSAVYYQGKK
ncbi:MAG: methyltransferase domain-containing protein [Candidatus Komeilibacteria bacterium]